MKEKINKSLLGLSIVLALIVTLGIGYTTRASKERACMLPPDFILGWTINSVMITAKAWDSEAPEGTHVEGRCMAHEDIEKVMEYMKAASGCWLGE